MTTARIILYGLIALEFAAAGILDLSAGQAKLGVVALLFGLVNGIIFFWRQG